VRDNILVVLAIALLIAFSPYLSSWIGSATGMRGHH
jgi:hypothetical protein